MKLLFLALLIASCSAARATTIAYDGKSLAADSQITRGGTKLSDPHKLVMIRKCVLGCAGDCDDITAFKRYFEFGGTRPELTNFCGLVLTNKGCFIYTDRLEPRQVAAPYAIGSGSESALGAMKAGANAKQAVEAACEVDLFSGSPVYVMYPTP